MSERQYLLSLSFRKGPLRPTLRAIPFPKVTELFCRLPSATLFYRPEAANLGDLMRLWVRLSVRIKMRLGFSRAAGSSPNPSKDEGLYQSLFPISRQDDSRDYDCKEEQITLPGAPSSFSELLCVTTKSTSQLWNINHITFHEQRKSALQRTSLPFRAD